MKLKDKINAIEKSEQVLSEMVAEYEQIVPNSCKHITDRLNATVTELKSITEALRQTGLPDEELLEALSDVLPSDILSSDMSR